MKLIELFIKSLDIARGRTNFPSYIRFIFDTCIFTFPPNSTYNFHLLHPKVIFLAFDH